MRGHELQQLQCKVSSLHTVECFLCVFSWATSVPYHESSFYFGGLQATSHYVLVVLRLHPAILCRSDFSQSLMNAAAASKSAVPAAAAGAPSLARVSVPSNRAPRTAFPGLNRSGPPNLARSSASGPLGAAAMHSMDAAPEQGHLQQPDLARASMPVQNRQGSSQLPPSGAPAKSGKSKGVMASMLGSVKKAVGIKSRTKDLQR